MLSCWLELLEVNVFLGSHAHAWPWAPSFGAKEPWFLEFPNANMGEGTSHPPTSLNSLAFHQLL